MAKSSQRTAKRSKPKQVSHDESNNGRRRYLSQSDVPSYDLEDALQVPKAIFDEYGGKPTRPLAVAKALNLTPTSPSFRQRCGAAIAYGLTEGGYNANEIRVLPLAKRILHPTTEEGDELIAKREAFLKPRVIGLFLTKYDGSKFPRSDIAENVLQEMGVPKEAKSRTLSLMIKSASALGLLTEINGSQYVSLNGVGSTVEQKPLEDDESKEKHPADAMQKHDAKKPEPPNPDTPGHPSIASSSRNDFRKKRVFITHGKDKAFIEPIKKLLGFGELEPVVSVERQTVSIAVPEKVMADMRSCGAAIIHVDAETKLLDKDANEQLVLNPNVLIEIGASMALYGKRFILLVRDGIKLPSNLQGLYEVRYTSDQLDGNATIRLLEAINDIKNHSLPD